MVEQEQPFKQSCGRQIVPDENLQAQARKMNEQGVPINVIRILAPLLTEQDMRKREVMREYYSNPIPGITYEQLRSAVRESFERSQGTTRITLTPPEENPKT